MTLAKGAASGPRRYVTLGNGRAVSLGSYVRAWRICRASLPTTLVRECPDGSEGTAGEALRQFRAGMADRINRHVPGYGHGRKWGTDWQAETGRLARAVNSPRLIVRWAPLEFRARLSHRLESPS